MYHTVCTERSTRRPLSDLYYTSHSVLRTTECTKLQSAGHKPWAAQKRNAYSRMMGKSLSKDILGRQERECQYSIKGDMGGGKCVKMRGG